MIRTLLAITKISGIADGFIKKHISVFTRNTNCEEIVNILAKESNKITPKIVSENLEWADNVIRTCNDLGITMCPIFDKNYPHLLKEISNPPAILYLLGNTDLLNKEIIAIIGTRKSTELGNKIAHKVGTYFSQKKVLCNGLVEGIDRNSVSSENSIAKNVIGILSGGLNFHNTISKKTASLAEEVLKNNGLLISEDEPNKKESQFSGSKSSRIQAGLSTALLLIQSSTTGGSKYTLKTFAKLGRILGYISFEGHEEYDHDNSFSANRLLDKEKVKGVAEICELKQVAQVKIKKFIAIHSTKEYETILQEIDSTKIERGTLF